MKLDVPLKFRPMYERAMSGRSRKAAIRCHCLMCVGWLEREVELCTARNCPLYPYRRGGAESLESTNTPTKEIETGGAA